MKTHTTQAKRPPDAQAEAKEYASFWSQTPPEARAQAAAARLAPWRARTFYYSNFKLDSFCIVPPDAPIMTRSLLQEFTGATLSDVSALRRVYRGQTSGSTGQPLELFMCEWALAHYHIHLSWGLSLLGRASRAQYGLKVLHLSWRTGAEATWDEAGPLWGWRIHRADVWDASAYEEVMQRVRPDVLTMTPSALEIMLDISNFSNNFSNLSALLVTSETLNEALRCEAARIFGCPVLNSYGAAELGPIALKCPAGAEVWHVQPGACWLEESEAGVLVTTLRNRAMPLTRYAPGDEIEGVSGVMERCVACGHLGQKFNILHGRTAESWVEDQRGERTSLVRWLRVLATPEHRVKRHKVTPLAGGVLRIEVEGPELDMVSLQRALDAVSDAVRITLSRKS